MNRSDPSSEPWGTSLHCLYKHVLHITTRTERWWFEWPQSWCDDCSQEMNWTNNLLAKILIIITCSLHWQIWFIKREELLWIRSFSSGSPLDQLDEAPTSSLTSFCNHSAGWRSRCWLVLAEHFSPSPQRHAVQYAETSPSPLHLKRTWIADYLEGNIPACSTAERQQHDWCESRYPGVVKCTEWKQFLQLLPCLWTASCSEATHRAYEMRFILYNQNYTFVIREQRTRNLMWPDPWQRSTCSITTQHYWRPTRLKPSL